MTGLYRLRDQLKSVKSQIRAIKRQPLHRTVTNTFDSDFFEGTVDDIIRRLTPLSDNGFGRFTFDYTYDYSEYDECSRQERRLYFVYTSTAPLEGEELEKVIAHRTKQIEDLEKRKATLEKQIAKAEMTEAEKERMRFAVWAKAHPEDAKKIIE